LAPSAQDKIEIQHKKPRRVSAKQTKARTTPDATRVQKLHAARPPTKEQAARPQSNGPKRPRIDVGGLQV